MALKEDVVRCSFCNKTQSQVRKLIAGPNGAYICDECIEICAEIIEEEFEYENEDNGLGEINLLKPEEIKSFLDDYVIGQEEAKRFFPLLYIIIINGLRRKKIWEWNCRKAIFLCLDRPEAERRFLHRRLQKC